MFVPQNMQAAAYDDSPLPIGLGQTISQPYIVAYMTEQLEPHPGMKVLEIGAGSGYQAAVLADLGCEVFTIELLEKHADRAREVISSLHDPAIASARSNPAPSPSIAPVRLTAQLSGNSGSVTVIHGNGFLGLPEEAPFDAIIVTAAPDRIPEALVEQLKDGGRMIIPVGDVYAVQSLKLLTKDSGNYTVKDLLPVRFVPMVDG